MRPKLTPAAEPLAANSGTLSASLTSGSLHRLDLLANAMCDLAAGMARRAEASPDTVAEPAFPRRSATQRRPRAARLPLSALPLAHTSSDEPL